MPTQAWIAIAVVAVLIITVLIVGLVRYRSRTISLEPRPDTPIDRSGGYQAGTGFSFSEGTRDGAAAARLMSEHLGHIQANLDLSRGRPSKVDLVSLFADP